jgi:hypothetical protein
MKIELRKWNISGIDSTKQPADLVDEYFSIEDVGYGRGYSRTEISVRACASRERELPSPARLGLLPYLESRAPTASGVTAVQVDCLVKTLDHRALSGEPSASGVTGH